jgi:transaldolase
LIDGSRELRERLLFETAPLDFRAQSSLTRQELAREFGGATRERQTRIVELVAELAIDLASYLPRWHLLAPGAGGILDEGDVRAEVEQYRGLLRSWWALDQDAAVASEIASIEGSNLRRLAELADRGEVDSRWGHDAATGLTWAVRRGAVLVTTNPVMVNTVRKDDPATWDPVRDALKAAHPTATAEGRASMMTMSVVLDECRELRPIWRATDGRYGNVSLQIDPRTNDDAGKMVEEVEVLYGRLREALGGPPNTRFKIPGTRAGLEAVRRLTARGIGVTVTVNASIDQQLAFAEVIEEGSAPLSFLVLMMGRLDDPVRDELMAAGLPDAIEVSRWASVAVLRRSYPLLFIERRFRRSAILAASMRGPWTIDGAIVDGPAEVTITCFPDKAREYDSVARTIESRVSEPLPPGVIDRLSRSATFREAYQVGALGVEAFDSFVPVVQTLDQFKRNYAELVDYNR